MADAEVAARMFDARQALETRERARLTLEELGKRIATAQGRPDDPYAPAVVKRWLEGDAEPGSIATWRAIASVFGVRVGWLAAGELPVRDDEGGEGDQGGGNVPVNGPPVRPRTPHTPPKSTRIPPGEYRGVQRPGKKKPGRKPGRTALAS